MAGSFTQTFCHGVITVKYRQAQISEDWEEQLYHVIGGALKELKHVPLMINGVDDHLHVLWRHHRTKSVAETMKIIKGRSSHWINDKGFTSSLFRWQPGYGAFSVSIDRVSTVKRYIARQKVHHAKESFKKEYVRLLNAQGAIDLEPYLFAPLA